jgi:glycosyltransferase involved in cell wall biosynthesis
MSAEPPLVSVVMAAHDGAAFIEPAVESVLTQTHRQLELIVVDDHSGDATADIVERMARADPRVTLIRRPVNEGPCRARRLGFESARGTYLCWIDQDDLWLPTKVEEQLAVMQARPDVGLVYTYFDAFDSATGATIPWPDGRRDHEGDVLGPLFVEGCFIGSITTMARRAALERRGLRIRDRDFSFGDDYYLWLGIALDWDVARIPRVLARYRRHAGNESARLAQRNVDLWRVQLLREFLAEFPDAVERLGRRRRTALARHYLLGALFEYRRGRRRQALHLAARSVSEDPLLVPRRGWGMLSAR